MIPIFADPPLNLNLNLNPLDPRPPPTSTTNSGRRARAEARLHHPERPHGGPERPRLGGGRRQRHVPHVHQQQEAGTGEDREDGEGSQGEGSQRGHGGKRGRGFLARGGGGERGRARRGRAREWGKKRDSESESGRPAFPFFFFPLLISTLLFPAPPHTKTPPNTTVTPLDAAAGRRRKDGEEARQEAEAKGEVFFKSKPQKST